MIRNKPSRPPAWRAAASLAAMLAAACAAPAAQAANIWLSLNLEFNTPGDFNSGGAWTVVGKADERGIAALVMYLDDINFDLNTGFLAPAIFYSLDDTEPNPLALVYDAAGFDFYGVIHRGYTETVTGQASLINRRFFDVGVIGGATQPGENGTPNVALGIASRQVPWGTYADDPLLRIYGANPDLGSFTGGVEIAAGTFDPGVVPDWAESPGEALGNNWRDTTSLDADDAEVFTTVRYVVPEPATIGLAGFSALALLVINRRRVC